MCFARCKESGKWHACLYNAIGHELARNKETGIPWGTRSPVLASPLLVTARRELRDRAEGPGLGSRARRDLIDRKLRRRT